MDIHTLAGIACTILAFIAAIAAWNGRTRS